jgi:ADP-glucose pyrophosphorylase
VIMRDAVIVGPASLGAGTLVHERAIVSRSVLWDRVSIGCDALVDRSILVHDASVAADARVFDAVRMPARGVTARRGPVSKVQHPRLPAGPALADLASS